MQVLPKLKRPKAAEARIASHDSNVIERDINLVNLTLCEFGLARYKPLPGSKDVYTQEALFINLQLKCKLILNLYAGHRREGDIQEQIEKRLRCRHDNPYDCPSVAVVVLSVDRINSPAADLGSAPRPPTHFTIMFS